MSTWATIDKLQKGEAAATHFPTQNMRLMPTQLVLSSTRPARALFFVSATTQDLRPPTAVAFIVYSLWSVVESPD